MRVGMKRAAILSGAAYVAAAAGALAGSLTAAGAALALAQLPPLTQLPRLGGRHRDAARTGRRGLAGAARTLARGERWRRREQILVRARSWQAPDPAEEAGVAWTVAPADARSDEGTGLWGVASSRSGAVVAFFPTRERAEAALHEVRAGHPRFADDSRRVVHIDLGLAAGDVFRPDRAAAMTALPPRILAASTGPNPFYLMQG
jgi:hypothetical protein